MPQHRLDKEGIILSDTRLPKCSGELHNERHSILQHRRRRLSDKHPEPQTAEFR